ncbi:hypothetical protein ACQCSU_08600 [Pseudarthrobacter sp. O4]|uniref:hypothetical protein n=1 Tax=Pseudarthrobacter sp. O4 TaxID=3418417 RepID=UPI003CF8C9D2
MGVIALTWPVLSMRVCVDVVAGHVVIRCRPFYTAKIRLSDILTDSKTSETTLTDGHPEAVASRITDHPQLNGPVPVGSSSIGSNVTGLFFMRGMAIFGSLFSIFAVKKVD